MPKPTPVKESGPSAVPGFIVSSFTPDELTDLLLQKLEARLNLPAQADSGAIEIIGREELCKRLNISPGTVISWEKKGKIPFLKIGSAIRYNWQKVVESLEAKKVPK